MHRGRVCQFDTRLVPAGMRLGRREQKRCHPDTSCSHGNAAGRARLSAGCSGTRPKHTRDAACMPYRGFCDCMSVRCRLAARSVSRTAGAVPGASASRCVLSETWRPACDALSGLRSAKHAVCQACDARRVPIETHRPVYAPRPQHLSGHVLPDIRLPNRGGTWNEGDCSQTRGARPPPASQQEVICFRPPG
jgi:hypothetical protein